MELLKYVYFYAQKSIIKAGYNKFQDLINAPRMLNLSKVYIHNACYNLSVSSVGMFFSNLFRSNEMGCFKYNSVKKAMKCYFSNCCFSLIYPLSYIFLIIIKIAMSCST